MSDIFEISDRAVDRVAAADPIGATLMGVAGHDHEWPDLSPDGAASRRELWADLATEATACPATGPDAVLARRVLTETASLAVEHHDAGHHLDELRNIASPFQAVKDVFDTAPRDTADAWRAVAERLATIDRPVSGYRQTLAAGIHADATAARRQVLATIDEGHVAAGPDSPFRALVGSFDATGIDDGALRDRLIQGADKAATVYGEFAEWLEAEYLRHASPDDGCGRERYERESRHHSGTSIDVDDTYQWGWSEVRRIAARMTDVAAQVVPGATTVEVLATLNSDPARAVHSVDAFLGLMQDVQDEALEQLLDVHFDVAPEVRAIDVKASPPGGALAPYYTMPSEDFSRPGTVWYPVESRTVFPLWQEMTTAYHEGFPGHHLQLGVQVAMGDRLSRFQRLAAWSSGSGEGWALYAERLMGEFGFHQRPEYELGMLGAEMMRACRVVIDIGLHCGLSIPADSDFHPGREWTWDLAVEMLRDVAGLSADFAASEATRYAGWPGQAITYKVGERTILQLRDQMRSRPGVELKDFHARVLGVGAPGLDVLRETVLGSL